MKSSVLNTSGEFVIVDTSDGSIQKQGLILITHIVLNEVPKNNKKHKVFFVVQNQREKFYWGTDNHDLDLEVIQKYVKNGTLKELKVPILIKNSQGLWRGDGEEFNLYVGNKIEGSAPFYVTLLGKFFDLVV